MCAFAKNSFPLQANSMIAKCANILLQTIHWSEQGKREKEKEKSDRLKENERKKGERLTTCTKEYLGQLSYLKFIAFKVESTGQMECECLYGLPIVNTYADIHWIVAIAAIEQNCTTGFPLGVFLPLPYTWHNQRNEYGTVACSLQIVAYAAGLTGHQN